MIILWFDVWCFLSSPGGGGGGGGGDVGGGVTSCLAQLDFWQTDVASDKNHTNKKSNQSFLINKIKKVRNIKGNIFKKLTNRNVITFRYKTQQL